MAIHETRARSVAKSLTWRAVATLATIGLVYAFTGELHMAVAVGAIEIVLKLAVFFLHERLWDGVAWGRSLS